MIDGLTGVKKWIVFGLLLLCHVFFFQIYPHFLPTNEFSRLLLVSAIVDDHSFSIDNALRRYGDTQDKSNFNGHYYTDKAIGTSLLGIPVYAVLQTIGSVAHVHWNPAFLLFALRVTCITIPSLLFLRLLTRYWFSIEADRKLVLSLTFIFLFGTIAFTYTLQYISHSLCGIFLFLSFHFLYKDWTEEPRAKNMFWAGIFSAMAVLTEYPAVFPVALLSLYAIFTSPKKQNIRYYFLGALPFAALLMVYNTAIFGTPFELTYRHQTDPYHVAEHAQGWIGLGKPRPEAFTGLLFSNWRGLFFFSPVLFFAIPGYYFFFRSKGHGKEALLFSGIIFSFVLFYCSMSNWDGGWALGPRYLAPVLPFLMTGTVFFFAHPKIRENSRMSFLLMFTGVLSMTYVVIGTITFPYPPRQAMNPFYTLSLPLFLNGAYSQNLAGFLPSIGPAILFFTLLVITWIYLTFSQDEIQNLSAGAIKRMTLPVLAAILLITAGYQLTQHSSAMDSYIRASVYLYQGKYEHAASELKAAEQKQPDEYVQALLRRKWQQLYQTAPKTATSHP